jgi:hypothetical protein
MYKSRRKLLLLHVGTHKTATTSLQAALAASSGELASYGTLYPEAGRINSGHHNIAWGLIGDERFDPAAGYLDELAEEIRTRRPARVILSSEDFEYLNDREDRLVQLRGWARRLGYKPVVVIGLRDAASYVESLYSELVYHGLTQGFDEFARAVLAERQVTFRSLWHFQFDYEALTGRFAAVFGRRAVVAIPYDTLDMVGAFGRRFSFLMGKGSIEADPIESRLNARRSAGDVAWLLTVNRLGAEQAEKNSRGARSMRSAARVNQQIRLDPVLQERYRAVFDAQRVRVLERYP